MLEKNVPAADRDLMVRVVEEYMAEKFPALFRIQMAEELPALRAKILNLDDYVTVEKFKCFEAASQEKLERQRQANQNLQEEKVKAIEEKDSVERKFAKFKDEKAAEISDMEGQINDLRGERDYYRKSYAALDKAYHDYLALSDAIRYQLQGIFGNGATVQGFFSGAVQEKHLGDFWEYLRYSLNNRQLTAGEEKILSGIFDFCFAALNEGAREPIYERMRTAKGARYDERSMMLTSDSRQLGRVKQTVLEGYQTSAGTVVKKSLIKLGE